MNKCQLIAGTVIQEHKPRSKARASIILAVNKDRNVYAIYEGYYVFVANAEHLQSNYTFLYRMPEMSAEFICLFLNDTYKGVIRRAMSPNAKVNPSWGTGLEV